MLGKDAEVAREHEGRVENVNPKISAEETCIFWPLGHASHCLSL